MYLEHINLVVNDMQAMLDFYRAAFPHWRIRQHGHSDWYGKPRRWLHFGDDNHYIALSDNGEQTNRQLDGHQIGLAHFCYVTLLLKATVQRLQQAGYPVAKWGPEHAFRRNVYFIDPAGFEVEFVEYLSDLPCERNAD